MWNKISNSSILFSKDFYKQKNENFYQNTIFINKVYYYFYNKGYLNILLNQIVNIFISIFIVFFMIFLINCVDYHGILTLNSNKYIYEFINLDNFVKLNKFVTVTITIFSMILLNKIINIIDDSIVYKHIKNYYNNVLDIDDNDLNYIKWESIVDKIKHSLGNNVFYINNVITCKENYLISLFDNNILEIDHLTSIMEWNLIYCILFGIFDSNFKIKEEIFTNKENIVSSINTTMKIVSIINFIFMPFIMTFILLYNIFNYGEYYYNNPSLIFSRTITRKSKWQLRYYNELEHEFNKRIEKASIHANNYTKLFNNNIYDTILRFVIFICSSIFIVLVVLSLINDKILLNLLLTENQSMLWFIGILASLITILRKKKSILDTPEEHINNLNEYIILDSAILENPNLSSSKKKVGKMFNYKYIILLKDFVYILISPFQLWKMSYNIDSIIDFVIDKTETHDELVLINKNANFEYMYQNNEFYENYTDEKTKKSLYYFCNNYNSWVIYMNKKLNYGSINIKII